MAQEILLEVWPHDRRYDPASGSIQARVRSEQAAAVHVIAFAARSALLSVDEVARATQRLGVTPAAVESRVHAGRQALRVPPIL